MSTNSDAPHPDIESAIRIFNNTVSNKTGKYGPFTNAHWQAFCALEQENKRLREQAADSQKLRDALRYVVRLFDWLADEMEPYQATNALWIRVHLNSARALLDGRANQ